MKYLILTVFGAGLVAGTVYYVRRPQPPPVASPEPVAEATAPQASAEQPPAAEPATARPERSTPPRAEPEAAKATTPPAATPSQAGFDAAMVRQAVDVLVSPESGYEQKQVSWKQLRDAGKLDQAITDLEQRTTADPQSAGYPAALGQAYLQKCATLQDVREQGILAMQADKAFDKALALDASNWEARFTKAVAMSYWPVNLNKGEEVIQHFQTLVRQQETQPPQPQFAETYMWLGGQYQKAGHNDDARAVWERGAVLFPNHEGLKKKLAAAL